MVLEFFYVGLKRIQTKNTQTKGVNCWRWSSNTRQGTRFYIFMNTAKEMKLRYRFIW